MASQQVLNGKGKAPNGRLMSGGEGHQLPKTVWMCSEHLRQKALFSNIASYYEIKILRDWPILWHKASLKEHWIHSPNDQTSDLLLYLLKWKTSGGDHLTGNLAPEELMYSSSKTYLRPSDCKAHCVLCYLQVLFTSSPFSEVSSRRQRVLPPKSSAYPPFLFSKWESSP